ncbi:MAG: MotA/TolQ/ExbB proton channel family protein [Armatimonadota bacterium]|nr:MotA/TolQ/ExbB proton channel family protein [Armatimonadota bacterium]
MATLTYLVEAGGPTMIVLLAASVLLVAVVAERWYAFARFGGQLNAAASGGEVEDWFADTVRLPLPNDPDRAQRLHEANVLRARDLLRARLPVLATLGALSPFIGLFGTVVGIMHSFEAVARQKGAGIEVVGAGIAEALICTAAGLAVAILAVLAYNVFSSLMRRHLDRLDLGYLSREEAG